MWCHTAWLGVLLPAYSSCLCFDNINLTIRSSKTAGRRLKHPNKLLHITMLLLMDMHALLFPLTTASYKNHKERRVQSHTLQVGIYLRGM